MMGEGIRNFALLLWAACAINSDAHAQTTQAIAEEQLDAPTEVMAVAKTSEGGDDVFIVEQPKDAPNPLGNPIEADGEDEISDETMPSDISTNSLPSELNDKKGAGVNDNNVVPESQAQQLGNKFQNTLMEANGMIYDVQAYPEADIPVIGDSANPETIYSPNVNP